MTDVVVSPAAQQDIETIALMIASTQPAAAERWVGAMERAFDLLAFAPDAGRPRNEIRRGYRSLAVGNYLVFYESKPEAVEIVRIVDGRRDLERLLGE